MVKSTISGKGRRFNSDRPHHCHSRKEFGRMDAKQVPKTIDEHISAFPSSTQAILQQLRKAIREAALEEEETISYRMPAFK